MRTQRPGGRELDGVGDEVDERLHDPVGVGAQLEVVGRLPAELDARRVGDRLHDLRRLGQQLGGPHRAHVDVHAPGLQALEVQRVVDQPREPLGVLARDRDHLVRLGRQLARDARLEQAQRAADRGQRRAQLVPDHRDEARP